MSGTTHLFTGVLVTAIALSAGDDRCGQYDQAGERKPPGKVSQAAVREIPET
jgi:hypothetical protein